MPRCLVIAGVFPPAGGAGSLRMVKLLKYLPDCGWDVDVVAPAGRRGWFLDPTLDQEIAHLGVFRVGRAAASSCSQTAHETPLRGRIAQPRRRRAALDGAWAWLQNLRAAAKDPRRRGFVVERLLPQAMGLVKAVRDHVVVPDEYVVFSLQAARAAHHLLAGAHAYDLLLTASFPYSCHLAGLWLRQRHELPWIVDLADPWAGHRFRGQQGAARRRADAFLEGRVLRAADGISVASPGMETWLQQTYGEAVAAKIRVIHNSHDPGDFKASVLSQAAARAPTSMGSAMADAMASAAGVAMASAAGVAMASAAGVAMASAAGVAKARPESARHLELLFLGSFDSRLTPPDPFLDALAIALRADCRVRERLRLRVIGAADLASSARIRDFLDHAGAPSLLRFESPMTHPQAVAALRTADALAVSVAPGASWHLTAKVLEYIATDRPIVACVPEGDCRALLQRCGGAMLFHPHETGPLADALVSAVAYGGFEAATSRDARVVAQFSAPAIAQQAAQWMRAVCRAAAAARGAGRGI